MEKNNILKMYFKIVDISIDSPLYSLLYNKAIYNYKSIEKGINSLYNSLDDNEKKVVSLSNEYSLADVSKKLDLSVNEVKDIEENAYKRIKNIAVAYNIY